MAVRGIDSLRSPCGQPTHCVRGLSNWLRQLSNPGRGFSSPSAICEKKLALSYELFFKYGGEGDRLASLALRAAHSLCSWSVQLAAPVVEPRSGLLIPECNMRKKSSHFRTSSSLNMAVRGIDSLRSPCGQPTHCVRGLSNWLRQLSNPGRGFSSPECNMRKKKKLRTSFSLNMAVRGIRTPIRCRIHTFRACSFSHSDTSPNCFAAKPHGWQRGATIGSWSKTVKKNFNDNYCLLIL